ncbi:hypothetical protein STBA_62890 [Streptomyces sp. MP131-18]|nr:hypothetical protein STBA_62890 [Streptomyces sp. MP131-18]
MAGDGEKRSSGVVTALGAAFIGGSAAVVAAFIGGAFSAPGDEEGGGPAPAPSQQAEVTAEPSPSPTPTALSGQVPSDGSYSVSFH